MTSVPTWPTHDVSISQNLQASTTTKTTMMFTTNARNADYSGNLLSGCSLETVCAKRVSTMSLSISGEQRCDSRCAVTSHTSCSLHFSGNMQSFLAAALSCKATNDRASLGFKSQSKPDRNWQNCSCTTSQDVTMSQIVCNLAEGYETGKIRVLARSRPRCCIVKRLTQL